MAEDNAVRGRCHCGAVAYRVLLPAGFSFVCHCDNCRRLNGSARLAGAGFGGNTLVVEKGTPKAYSYAGGKDAIDSYFCPDCGTHLYAFPKAHPDTVVVRVGTLHDQNAFPPRTSIHADQACSWDKPL